MRKYLTAVLNCFTHTTCIAVRVTVLSSLSYCAF